MNARVYRSQSHFVGYGLDLRAGHVSSDALAHVHIVASDNKVFQESIPPLSMPLRWRGTGQRPPHARGISIIGFASMFDGCNQDLLLSKINRIKYPIISNSETISIFESSHLLYIHLWSVSQWIDFKLIKCPYEFLNNVARNL